MSNIKTSMTKEELNDIFLKECKPEINNFILAREELKSNPNLSEVIDLDGLQKKLYQKHIKVCVELVRTEQVSLDRVSDLMSLTQTSLGLAYSPELKRIFISYFDNLARQN